MIGVSLRYSNSFGCPFQGVSLRYSAPGFRHPPQALSVVPHRVGVSATAAIADVIEELAVMEPIEQEALNDTLLGNVARECFPTANPVLLHRNHVSGSKPTCAVQA